MSTPKKNLLFIFKSTPYGGMASQEAFDAIVSATIFEQNASALFIDDGVFQLIKGQQPSFRASQAKQLSSLPFYDLEKVYACKRSVQARDIKTQNFCLDAELLSQEQIFDLIHCQDHILSF